MKKYLVILFVLLIIPLKVYALEDSVLYDKLDAILGNGVLEIKDVEFLQPTLLNGEPEVPVDEPEFQAYDLGFSRAVASYIYNLDEVKDLIKKYSDEHPVISVFCISKTNCGIGIDYDSDQRGDYYSNQEDDGLNGSNTDDLEYPGAHMKHYDVSVQIAQPNLTKYSFIKNLYGSAFDQNFDHRHFYLYDLAYINQLYNFNKGHNSLLEYASANPSMLAKNFPEMNKFVNSDLFSLKYAMWSNMGDEYENHVQLIRTADYVSYYENVAYLAHTFQFHIAPVLLVPPSTPDENMMEAAKSRIIEYINDPDLVIRIDDITPTFSDEEYNEIWSELDDFLINALTIYVNGGIRIYSLKIGASASPYNLYIVRAASEEQMKRVEIEAIEKKTGVKMTTYSADVPIDSQLYVDDVTYLYSTKNKDIVKAYDLHLFSDINDRYIRQMTGGIKVYIPVGDHINSTDYEIIFLDDNGKIKEEYSLDIEIINGQKYATFTTNHLSTYGILNLASPKTGVIDITVVSILIIIFSILAFKVSQKQQFVSLQQ